jgi:PAS domain-containing protein
MAFFGGLVFKKASAVKDRSLVETGSLHFMEGGGEMEERIREFNWEATPLGPPAGWPQALKTLVNLMLASKQPMFLARGPQRTWLYNDAFTPILGRKHPSALGQPSMQAWAEAREVLEPMFDRVFAGEPVSIEDFSLDLDRKGRRRGSFRVRLHAARGDDGSVEGLFGACIETTGRIQAERLMIESAALVAALGT